MRHEQSGIWAGTALSAIVGITVTFAAHAQPTHSEFIVTGDAAAATLDSGGINLATARAIGSVCARLAEERGVAVSVYVLDNGGNHVYVHRMDGQVWTNVATASIYVIDNTGLAVHAERMDGQQPHAMQTALLKAETALRGRGPTSSREAGVHNNPGGYPRSVTLFGFYSVAGGVPIVVDNQLIGSVGVSGTDGHDEACAVAGLEAAFGDRATVPVY